MDEKIRPERTRAPLPRALLVDDDPMVLEWLSYQLEARGFETRRAADGLEGLARLAEEAFDLVLCDLDMPRLGGIETLEGVKKKDPSIEVIMVTGDSTLPRAIECMQKGAYDYVTKPLDAPRLEVVVRRALERRRLGRLLAELEQLNHMKSAFLSNVSHELREPLNVMLGYASLLAQGECGPLNDNQRQTLSRLEARARELLGVVNNLLDYSRFSVGDVQAIVKDVALGPAVQKVLGEFDEAARAKGLTLANQTPGGMAVRTDAELFSKLLRQLISNAVKFTDKGGVTVSARRLEGSILLAIRDTGIGIDPKDHALLFDAFRQSEASLTRSHGGTGIGLAIVKKLSQVLGVGVSYEAPPGGGAVFSLSFPLDGQSPS